MEVSPPTPTKKTKKKTPAGPPASRGAPRPQVPRAAGPTGSPGESSSLSVRFGMVARVLAEAAKASGWACPAFRSPPGLVGVSRSIRRQRNGHVTVAVAIRGRPWAAVLADMVEGVVATNRLRGRPADRFRSELWESLNHIAEAA